MSDLRERLGLLGLLPPQGAEPVLSLGPGDREARARALAAAIPGSEARRHREGWVVEREVLLPTLGPAQGLSWAHVSVGPDLARLAGAPDAEGLALGGAVALDVETTGLGFGAGTYAFLVGLLRLGWAPSGHGTQAGQGARLWQGLMADPVEEPALLARIEEELADAPLVLTFNGRAFDLPLLAARAALYRRVLGPLGRPHLDLLGPCRGLFRPRIGGCALARLQAHVLLSPRHDDVPGAAIPDLYRAFLRLGAPAAAPLCQVARHNALDLEAVAHLALLLRSAMDEGSDGGLANGTGLLGLTNGTGLLGLTHGADWLGLARCRRRLGDTEGALRAYTEALQRLGAEAVEASRALPIPSSSMDNVESNPRDSNPLIEAVGPNVGGLPVDHPALTRPNVGVRGSPRQQGLPLGVELTRSARDAPGQRGPTEARARYLGELAGQAGLEAARLRLRAGAPDGARELFQSMRESGQGGLAPWVELAKLAEHRDRDFVAALSLVDEALDQVAQGRFLDERALGTLIHGLRHRRDRLRRRLARAPSQYKR